MLLRAKQLNRIIKYEYHIRVWVIEQLSSLSNNLVKEIIHYDNLSALSYSFYYLFQEVFNYDYKTNNFTTWKIGMLLNKPAPQEIKNQTIGELFDNMITTNEKGEKELNLSTLTGRMVKAYMDELTSPELGYTVSIDFDEQTITISWENA